MQSCDDVTASRETAHRAPRPPFRGTAPSRSPATTLVPRDRQHTVLPFFPFEELAPSCNPATTLVFEGASTRCFSPPFPRKPPRRAIRDDVNPRDRQHSVLPFSLPEGTTSSCTL
jgi:hypothetical protein